MFAEIDFQPDQSQQLRGEKEREGAGEHHKQYWVLQHQLFLHRRGYVLTVC